MAFSPARISMISVFEFVYFLLKTAHKTAMRFWDSQVGFGQALETGRAAYIEGVLVPR